MNYKKIRELREAAGMTQEELAEKIEVGQGWVSKIESGRRPVSSALLFCIARVFGVSSDVFDDAE